MTPRLADTTIRRARFTDFPAVRDHFLALHEFNASLDPAFGLAAHWEAQLYSVFTDTHAHHDALWLVAWNGEVSTGFLWATVKRESPVFARREWVELAAIQVAPAAAGSGLAQVLIADLVAWTHTIGLGTVQAYVTASNVRALAFYDRQGFLHSQSIVRLELDGG